MIRKLFIVILALLTVVGAWAAEGLICQLAPGADPWVVGKRHGVTVVDITEDAPFVLYLVPPGVDPHVVQAALNNDPEVVWAEDNAFVEAPENSGASRASTIAAVGNPANFSSFNANLLQQIKWVPAAFASPPVRVRVAVIDTGASPNVPHLQSRIMASLNCIEPGQPAYDLPYGTDTNGNGVFDEAAGHGTMVAGIIVNLAPHADLVVIRAADSDGVGSSWTLTKALAFAVVHNARVANISLGSIDRVPAISDVLQWTEDNGLTVVGAAGNNGMRTKFFPASISKVLSVTGVDASDRKATFANWDSSVDVCAPAVGIRSYYYNGQMAVWEGTSFSAPMFAAAMAAGLHYRKAPITPRDLRDLAEDTGDDIEHLNPLYGDEIGTRLNFRALVYGIRRFVQD